MKRLAVFLLFVATTITAQQVPFERILNATKEPQNWLTYGGTLLNQRYSLLNQITTENVKNLELQWVLQVRAMDGVIVPSEVFNNGWIKVPATFTPVARAAS